MLLFLSAIFETLRFLGIPWAEGLFEALDSNGFGRRCIDGVCNEIGDFAAEGCDGQFMLSCTRSQWAQAGGQYPGNRAGKGYPLLTRRR